MMSFDAASRRFGCCLPQPPAMPPPLRCFPRHAFRFRRRRGFDAFVTRHRYPPKSDSSGATADIAAAAEDRLTAASDGWSLLTPASLSINVASSYYFVTADTAPTAGYSIALSVSTYWHNVADE